MPSCLVQYRVVIAPRSSSSTDPLRGVAGTALVDEEWEADEWGDPGRCVQRRALIELRGDDGDCYLDLASGPSGLWHISDAKIAGPIRWAGDHDLDEPT